MPQSTTARTICSRPFGVKRAFLCVSIRSSGESLKSQQPQLPRPRPNGQPPGTSQLAKGVIRDLMHAALLLRSAGTLQQKLRLGQMRAVVHDAADADHAGAGIL